MENIVQTNRLSKRIKKKELITDVSLHIRKGEIYGFLGQNGAGKTTIMKMLTGLTKPTSGDVELFGERLTVDTRYLLKRVGSVIEYPIFYEHMTAQENLKLHCEYVGFYDSQAIEQAIDLVQLKGINGKTVKEYSLGMKQRLGIARAIIAKPELIILDEPTNGLDPIGIKDIRDLIRILNKEYGITFLLSSHILGEIEQVADRIGVISSGKLINEVSLSELRSQNTEYLELVTTESAKAVFLLENELGLTNLKMISGNRIRIYEPIISQSEVSRMLVLHGVELLEMKKHSNSLEDYFYHQINENGGVRVD